MPSFGPPLTKYKQGGLASKVVASGYPSSPYVCLQQYQGVYANTDSYLRLHASGHFEVNFFGSGTQAPFEGWSAFSAWLVATWTQGDTPATSNLQSGLDNVIGVQPMLPTAGPLHGTTPTYSVRWDTPEPLILTNARKGAPSGPSGPWLAVYILIRDPFGIVSSFTAYNTTCSGITQLVSDWGTPP